MPALQVRSRGETPLRRAASLLLNGVVAVAITLGLVEASLRLYPEAIPPGVLRRFEDDLRLRIAGRRGLPNRSQVWTLERDDGGPKLELFRPFTEIRQPWLDAGTEPRMALDANGFCNPLPDGGYAAPRIDVLALGDSFTWCAAVRPEETWSQQLSRLLGRPVYNLGRGGVGVYEYLQILQRFGLSKRPDVVVLNVYEGNDLRDADLYWRAADARAADDAPEPAEPGFLRRRSYAVNLMLGSISFGRQLASEIRGRIQRGEPPWGLNFRYRLRFAQDEVAFNTSNTDTDEVETAWALRDGHVEPGLLRPALQRFVALSRAHGFLPLVAYSPSAHTAYADFVQFEDPSLAAPLAAYSRGLRDFLSAAASEMGFVFVDATPALAAAAERGGPGDLLYFPTNLHYTPEGHRVLAETLAHALAPRE